MKTPTDVREDLIQELQTDLIGFDNQGDLAAEVLSQAPSRWYLTGFLVPIDASEEQRAEPTSNEGAEALEPAGGGGGDDAVIPEPATARHTYLPSSMGMSILVPMEAKALEVTANWGDYAIEDHPIHGRAGRNWRRIPRVAKLTVTLADLPADTSERPVPNSHGLILAISARHVSRAAIEAQLTPAGTRAISLFLVNRRRPAPDDARDQAFVFQAKLDVRCNLPLVPRPDVRGRGFEEFDERIADLQYRDVAGYGVGHGASVEICPDPELDKLPKSHRKFRANRSLRDVEPNVDLWMRTLDDHQVDAEEDDE